MSPTVGEGRLQAAQMAAAKAQVDMAADVRRAADALEAIRDTLHGLTVDPQMPEALAMSVYDLGRPGVTDFNRPIA